jgi:hypothetical protein
LDVWVRYGWCVFNVEWCRRGAVIVSNAICGDVVIAVPGWKIHAWWHLTSIQLRQPFDLFRNHSINPIMLPSLSVFIFWLIPVLFTDVVRERECHGRRMPLVGSPSQSDLRDGTRNIPTANYLLACWYVLYRIRLLGSDGCVERIHYVGLLDCLTSITRPFISGNEL